jgi:hypothetical protein
MEAWPYGEDMVRLACQRDLLLRPPFGGTATDPDLVALELLDLIWSHVNHVDQLGTTEVLFE